MSRKDLGLIIFKELSKKDQEQILDQMEFLRQRSLSGPSQKPRSAPILRWVPEQTSSSTAGS